MPFSTPLDVRKGLTKASDVNHKLNWGIISASAIASDWIKSAHPTPPALLLRGALIMMVAARCWWLAAADASRTSPAPR